MTTARSRTSATSSLPVLPVSAWTQAARDASARLGRVLAEDPDRVEMYDRRDRRGRMRFIEFEGVMLCSLRRPDGRMLLWVDGEEPPTFADENRP